MAEFSIATLEQATISNDRTRVTAKFASDKGPVELHLNRPSLDTLITWLRGLVWHASLLNPAAGPQHGETGEVSVAIVDSYMVGQANAKGMQHVALALRSGTVSDFYALDRAKAIALAKALGDEVERLPTAAPKRQ